jgi:hypothetical protein
MDGRCEQIIAADGEVLGIARVYGTDLDDQARAVLVDVFTQIRARAAGELVVPQGCHDCVVPGCPVRLHARYLMCRPHWRMVPRGLQAGVYRHYRRGQTARTASDDYLAAAQAAVAAVQKAERTR